MNRIITIGREFGSGGREIGRRLAERLQIAYYDQEIVTELVKRTQLAADYVRRVEETQPLPLIPITTGRSFWPSTLPVIDEQLSIFTEESHILTDMAEKSSCVIVGRCADYVLRDMEPFRLFIYADMDFKMERCRQREDDVAELNDKALRSRIQTIDKRRSKYYSFFTDQEWGARENYDLCVNSAKLGIKGTVNALAAYLA